MVHGCPCPPSSVTLSTNGSDRSVSRQDPLDDWHLYLVRCRDGSLYTGITTDVERRLQAHRANLGAKYLRGRGPLVLVFQKRIGAKQRAFQLERAIKRWPKYKKEKLVRRGPGSLNLIIDASF